jgi:gamma-glutamyl:cysteine ligase YbdK (ATP-grasp superfamily)
VAARVLETVRPAARGLGSEWALAELERILREGNGADEQRRIERQVGLGGLLENLVERSR